MTRSFLPAAGSWIPALLLTLLSACGPDMNSSPSWELVWSDEFEGPEGSPPDPTKWVYDIGTDWGNAQSEWTTDRPENVSLDGEGNLRITAREELFNGQPYTAARIKTQGRFERTYGRFEARIDLPVGQGIWPAFWMLGNDIDSVGWPQSGEIDIMEFVGQEPSTVHGTLHGPGHSADDSYTSEYTLPEGTLDSGFNVYAIEWFPDSISWYLNDQRFHVARRGEVPGEWVYDHPFFMLLNIAVGGRWPGYPDETTVFPQEMRVDYVRVYEAGE